MTASMGAGSVVAAVTLALRRESRGLSRWRAVCGLGVGLCMMAFAASRNFALSATVAAALGFCLILFFAASNTILQLRTPDAMRGRVMALYAVTLVGMAPFGSLLAGGTASLLGAPLAIALAGGLCLTGVAASLHFEAAGQRTGQDGPTRPSH